MFRKIAVGLLVSWIAVAKATSGMGADELPPTAEQVRRLMAERPLSIETWPAWRDYYVRLYFADANEPEAFTNRLREFHSELSQEAKLAEWESDPIVWVIRSGELRRRGHPGNQQPAVEASRKALSLGDPGGMSSVALTSSLISQAAASRSEIGLPAESLALLNEAENHLSNAAAINPQASLTAWRGLIAGLRGEVEQAVALLKQAVDERPNTPWIASQYLSFALGRGDHGTAPRGDLTRPFVERFPESPEMLSWHAVALYQDREFQAAAAALTASRQFGDQADKYFPAALLKEIEASAELGPKVAEAFQAFDEKRYSVAAGLLREAWNAHQRTQSVARVLMFSQLYAQPGRIPPAQAAALATQFGELVAAYPDDGQMHAGYAVALASAGRFREAQQALDRARQAGADVEAIISPEGVREIRRLAGAAANQDAANAGLSMAGITGLSVAAGVLIWVGIMFLVGAILAVAMPRVPDASLASAGLRSSREIWLERFYLLALSLGLIVFYLSVPFVVLGIVAVTLGLVFLLLVVRILHYGLLYRGGWAAWHMVRCIFWGPSDEVFGIELQRDDHPRLFDELHAVAEQIRTKPVERVFLVPGAQVSVSQEGAGPFGLFGRRRRVLHVGMCVLPWLSINEFRSILAHEYGHFSQRDPFIGRFIFQVSATLANSLAIMQAAAGWLNYVNPFYGIYWLYLRAYALLSAGYSRSREFLADRRAVLAYGKKSFKSGLTKICGESDLFDNFAFQTIHDQLIKGSVAANIFNAYGEYRVSPEAIDVRGKLLAAALDQKPGWFDSHPTFPERVAAVDCFDDGSSPTDSQPAINLINQPNSFEESLTRLMTERVQQYMIAAA